MEQQELISFLNDAKLGHLAGYMIGQGVNLEILTMANDHELTLLSPKVGDKIKLRIALEKLQNKKAYNSVFNVPEPTTPSALPECETSNVEIHIQETNETSQGLTVKTTSPVLITPKTEINLEDENDLIQDDPLTDLEHQILGSLDYKSLGKEDSKNLRSLLSSVTIGKLLLEKADREEELSTRDRAFIVKVIVETELKTLNNISTRIQKNVWQEWANEVVSLFKGESAAVYYMPYTVIGGKVIQASGLFHNRLITHRRILTTETKKRKSSTSSETSDNSVDFSKNTKRVRPLPKNFRVYSPKVDLPDSSLSARDCFNWLQISSSPKELVKAKWLITFALRNNKLSESQSYKEYFSCFPALALPNGHELLSLDFEVVYPNSNIVFEERFPLIKAQLLQLLAKKGDSSRPDQTVVELLDLADIGEQQASLAAFLAIISLLRQMPIISIPRKKLWKLSKEEVRSSFIGRVATASDIERFCSDRDSLVATKGIPAQPYILAVGSSWATVTHYEIVIYNGLRYQVPDICSAIKTTFHIYWALDAAYPKDSAVCWMFVQLAIFNMKSRYDTEGVPLRELLQKFNIKFDK